MVKLIEMNIVIDEKLLIAKQDQKYNKKEDRKDKKIESGIEMQVFVVKIKQGIWRNLYEYYKKYELTSKISRAQLDILKKMSLETLQPPSEKQSKILYQLYEKAERDGVAV